MSFIFDSVDRFIAGTVGAPGERAFFIQVRFASRLVTVALEKVQVAALAQRLEMLISELRRSNPSLRTSSSSRDDEPLEVPIEPEFEVGAISIAWDESEVKISIDLFEMTTAQEESANSLRIYADIPTCAAFVKRSKALVNAGRFPCPFCAIPIDPTGHLCPRANGYRR